MTNIWACPRGTTGRPAGARFRNAFLGTVAAGALSLAFGGPALACTLSGGGTIETCSGNQSAGIAIAPPTTVTTLNVNNLTQAIAPPSGTTLLLPFTNAVVPTVDLAGGRVVIALPDEIEGDGPGDSEP